jgi:transcriptional regulator with XRE-family HTH domain
MLVGDRLKDLREGRSYTHQELAHLLDLSITQVWRYETGKTDPSGEILARMAKVFNVSVDYLLGVIDDPLPPGSTESNLSDQEKAVIQALRRGQKIEAIKVIVGDK